MLLQLARGEADVSSLARPFLRRMSLPAVTKHLRVLERAGLITKRRVAQRRPCRLNTAALKDIEAWTEVCRTHFEESLDRLDAYLKVVTATAKASPPNHGPNT
jgi:DNA-binding transcriptional ArsR family regulator